MSRLCRGVAVLGVAAAAWLLPGEALAAAPTSKPKQDTKQARALLEKAQRLIKGKQFAEAAELTQRCIEVASEYPDCHLKHGTVMARLGRVAEGAKHYRRFVELAPDAPEASKVREMLKQYDEKR